MGKPGEPSQTSSAKHGPNTIPWPPLLFVGAVVLGLGLNFVAPFTSSPVFFWPGLLLLVAGLGLDAWAIMTLRKANTTIMPHRPAERLVTGGPFAHMRHPIYFGNTVAIAGLGLVLGNAWLPVLGLCAAWLTDRLAAQREEAHLKARFGEVWLAYAAQVKRWGLF